MLPLFGDETVTVTEPFDVAIIGSGFAGTILARVLHRLGRRVVVLEKGHHPRFALGESTTPLANFALERLARRSGLKDLFDLATYGRWQHHLPHLRCGLKRGFTFYHHRRDRPFQVGADNSHRLLVAASPEDALADTHWLRADVDHHLVERARTEGVEVHEHTAVENVQRLGDGSQSGWRVLARQRDTPVTFQARILVDGSGSAAVVPQALGLTAEPADSLPQARLLFTHGSCPPPLRDLLPEGAPWPEGPYPDQRAAVHHLIDEGWIYVLPFDTASSGQAIASLGAVLYGNADNSDKDAPGADPETAWQRLLNPYPTLAAQMGAVNAVRPWQRIETLAYRQRQAAGDGWFLLPHTYAFVDPMFSTGMAWSLLAVERLVHLLGGDPKIPDPTQRDAYARLLSHEADQITRLIRAARAARHDPALFRQITFLYFAAVSHAELRQRLLDPLPGETPCRQGLLGASDPRWRQTFDDAVHRVQDDPNVIHWLKASIRPWDAIGLDLPRGNLYPVDLDVLLERAHVLGMDRDRMEASLPRLRGERW